MTDQREWLSLTVGNEVRAAPTGETASERAGRSVEPGPQDASSGWIPATGRVIDNPISGERIVIRTSGAQTGGALLAFDLFLPPGGHVPARHVHPIQEERFTILDGELRFEVGHRAILATRGETVLIPPG